MGARRLRSSVLAVCLLAIGGGVAVADPDVHVLPVRDLVPGERRPLLVFLHGLGGSGAEALANPEIRGLAERGRMVLVAPDGTFDGEGRRFWNAGPACCNFDGKAVNDVARLEALISHWLERPEIDPARAYIVGFSNGGFMAHRLACLMDDQLAAVVSISGAGRSPDEACAPVSSIAVLDVHGDADPVVQYHGGRVFNDARLAPHPSVPQTFQGWAERLGCPVASAPKVTTVDLDPRLPGAETRVESYPECSNGAAELWTVHGGRHQILTPALLARVGTFLADHPKLSRQEREARRALQAQQTRRSKSKRRR